MGVTCSHWVARTLVLFLITGTVTFMSGCSGRRVGTSVQDQTVAAGHPAKAERAKPESIITPPPAPATPAVPPVPQEEPLAPAHDPTPDEPPTEAKILDELRRSEPEVATAEPPLAGREEAETVATPPPPVVSSIELADVFFDFDDFSIRRDAKPMLEANAQLITDHAGGMVIIEGHCDERGSADYNLVLGERRAQAVKRYLQKRGIQPSRLQVITYGKERPFCMEHTEECYQKNRRAHFEYRQE
jgi:peptidoglycan-associated lipoprotein